MAYETLYRKYRSQTFDDVIGQDHVVRTIRNAIKADRIGHGYLFCGSRGTGKTTVARLVAKALNCAHGPTPDPCDKCDECNSITHGAAVDVIEMDAASNRSVDDIDALRDGVKYPPMHLRYKVYIIDEAHQLSATAKDAFLKTLEEPPPHAVFILATTESNKIPITIRSRCQQFDFRRGTVSEIGGRLKTVAKSEKLEIDADAIDLLARIAGGSYRDSLSLLEQVMAYADGKVTTNDIYTVSGMVNEDALLEIGGVLSTTDTAAAFALADRLMREGRDVRELLKSAANHFRDVLELKVGADKRHSDDPRWMCQADALSEGRLVSIIDIFAEAEKDLRWNEQHRLALEMAFLKAMARPKEISSPAVAVPVKAPVVDVQQVHTPPTEVKPKEPKSVKATPPQAKSAPKVDAQVNVDTVPEQDDVPEVESSGTQVSLAIIQREWQKVLRHVEKVLRQPNIAALARAGQPVKVSDGIITLGFAQKWRFHKDKVGSGSQWIEQGLMDVLGAKLKLTTMLVDEPEPEQLEVVQQSADQVAHPLLNDVLTTFGGTVVEENDFDPWKEQS